MTDSSVAAGRVALVTGGARGIGRAIAEGLRAIGAEVAVLDADGDALDACGLDGLKIRADIASPVDSAAAVARVCELHRRLDILVNNAGLGMGLIREDHFARPVALAEIMPEHWRRMFEVNCMGAFLMMRAVCPGWWRAAGAAWSTSPPASSPCSTRASRPTARPRPRSRPRRRSGPRSSQAPGSRSTS